MSIIKLLNQKIQRTLFTTPSHNQHPNFSQNLADFYKYDYSEIEDFDNLSNPKGAILMAQGKASDCFNTKQTFFVTQGATTAILSAMKAIIKPGDKVLVARNCHKSVYSGLILTAGMVDWFMPEIDFNWGIYSKINPRMLESHLELDDYKAFIMVSPTYEGINSDIETIADICKAHKTYLIVDEAHGSLYNFSNRLPKTAIEQGADVSINSLHKTAGALNQTALLHISKDIRQIDTNIFQQALNIFQTTSPSYPLLANIEACISYLDSSSGRKEINNLIDTIEKMKPELERFGVQFYRDENHDPTKLYLRKQGISGMDLSDILFRDYKIEDEMANLIGCLYLTGIGTTRQKLDKLKSALKKVQTNPSYEYERVTFQPHPLVKVQPFAVFGKDFMFVDKKEAINKVSNRLIMPYPPGIGILYPGEAIQQWHLDYLNNNVEVII